MKSWIVLEIFSKIDYKRKSKEIVNIIFKFHSAWKVEMKNKTESIYTLLEK